MTIVPALGEMVVAFPSVVSASAFGKLVLAGSPSRYL